MYYPQTFYPYGYRPQVQYGGYAPQWRPPIYPQYQVPQIRYPYYPQYQPTYTQPIIPSAQSYIAPTYQPQPMLSQIIQSPQRNFQSPDRLRVAQSPQRNVLMQSQQVPRSPQIQSPQKKYLTYEEVQERLRNAQQPQRQQAPPQPHQKNTPQQPKAQSRTQQAHPQTKQQPQQEDLDKRYQNALKSTEEIIKKYQMEDSGSKPRDTHNEQIEQNDEPQQEEEDESQLQELALQYEDGYIYRGQGYPPQTRSGFGILTDENSTQVYAGYWKNNLYEGQGRLANLQIEELTEPIDWNNMTTIGNGWASYEGNFHQGKMHGQGTLVLSNKEQYFGEFEDGMVHGDGEFQTLDGQTIKGKWEQGYLTQLSEQE